MQLHLRKIPSKATDRAHRIGQKNKVTVIKLITKGTIEERILELQNKKKILSDNLIEGKNIHVIPTRTVPEGIAAALAFNADDPADVNKINMLHATDYVVSGQVTYAVRNTKIDDFTLKKGDIIGLDDKRILAKGSSIKECTLSLVEALIENNHSIISTTHI